VELIVRVIDDGLDAANRTAVTPREEERSLGVLEEWMARPVEQLAVVAPERRHEVGPLAVETVRKIDELAPRPALLDRHNLERRHRPSVARRRGARDIY
jgi:hypothetical protein